MDMSTTQAPGTPARRGRPRGPWPGLALAALAWAAPAPAASQTQVYRCQGPSGAVEFRQEPCTPESPGTALTIEDHPTGWTPTPASPAATPKAAPHPHRKGAGKHGSGPSAKERQAQACQKKRQQVEDIDRKLRLGTRGRQGADLRHRRLGLEDYLYENCD